ncbi:MAG: IS200/IS605 family transposase [Balneolaceae bacterium]
MPKTYNSIWVHILFSTKYRVPYLTWNIRGEICTWIKNNGNAKSINIDVVYGVDDHLHVLVKLKPTQRISDIVNWKKGASSHWLNTKYTWENKFAWQEGYGVFSVSQNDINHVREYIYTQEFHHKTKSFITEIKELVKD